MSDSRDSGQRNADLEWLYGGRKPEPEQTKIFSDAEEAELRRRAQLRQAQLREQRLQEAQDFRPEENRLSPDDQIFSNRPRLAPSDQTTHYGTGSTQSYPLGGQPLPHRYSAYQNVSSPGSITGPNQNFDSTYPASYQVGDLPTAAKKTKKRRHPIRRTILVLFLLALAWAVYLVSVPLVTLSKFDRVADSPAGARPSEQPGTAILLVGSDSREDLSTQEQQQMGTGDTAGKRTDSMMILFQPTNGEPALVSLPRDSYVKIPGHGENKLNAAFAFGGPSLLIETIEQTTGLRIDGYVEIGFGGFVQLVDIVEGVEMCLPEPMVDRDSHTNLPAGCQTLSGQQALGYVRMRKADSRGDVGRMERQREFLSALIKKLMDPMILVNPIKYWQVNNSLVGLFDLGESTSNSDLVSAARAFLSISRGKGTSLPVPIAKANGVSPRGQSIVIWDETKAKAMFTQLANGDTSNMDQYKTEP